MRRKMLLLGLLALAALAALLQAYAGPVFFLPSEDAAAIRFKRRGSLGLVVPDPELGHALRSGHDRVLEWRGRRYETRQAPYPGQSRLGFRLARGGKSPETADLAALGDSFTLGMEVDAARAWPALLSRETGLSVVNLGVPSYGTAQERLLYRLYGRSFKPKWVLLLLVTNDPRDNAIFAQWKGSRSEPGGVDFVEYKFCAQLGLEPGRACRGAKFLMTRCGAAVNVLLTQLVTVWMNLTRTGEDFEGGMRALLEDVQGLGRETSASGARLAVLVHPNWSLPRWTRLHPRARDELMAMLREEGIPALDLGPALGGYTDERLEIRLDGHWNEAGHKAVAARTAEFLRGLGAAAAKGPPSSEGGRPPLPEGAADGR